MEQWRVEITNQINNLPHENTHTSTKVGHSKPRWIHSLEGNAPLTSHASVDYLNNNYGQNNSPAKRTTISIQTSLSQPYSTPTMRRSTTPNRQSRNRNLIHRNPRNSIRSRRKYPNSNVKLTSLLIVGATFLGSSLRASHRGRSNTPLERKLAFLTGDDSVSSASKPRIVRPVRTTTPFGIIRNISLLGNGVSVIRVRMALEFGGAGNGGKIIDIGGGGKEHEMTMEGGGNGLLEQLQQERNSFHDRMMVVMAQKFRGDEERILRQRILGNHVSNCKWDEFLVDIVILGVLMNI